MLKPMLFTGRGSENTRRKDDRAVRRDRPPRHLFEKLGFKDMAHLAGFVKDLEGAESDLVLMIKDLNTKKERA